MDDLREYERLNEVNDHLTLIERRDGLLFGSDALLLAGFIKAVPAGRALELGGGSGIISLLVATRNKFASVTCAEIQPEYADLITRNVELNHLTDRVFCVNADIRESDKLGEDGSYDVVFSNPPYMPLAAGLTCDAERKTIARHEIYGGISDFAAVAAKKVKYGGHFYCVFHPERLTDLIVSLRKSGLEPKRITFVYPDAASKPSMILTDAIRGGKPGCVLSAPFILYTSKNHKEYTDAMNDLLDHGNLYES